MRLIIPKDRPLAWHVQQGESVQLVRSVEREMDVYSFYVSDSPRIPDEPASPPLGRMAARLVFSAFRIGAPPSGRSPNPTGKDSGSARASRRSPPSWWPVRRTKARDWSGSYAFVTRAVRSVPLSIHCPAYAPHAPDEILDKRYGDAKDKAILAGAMLAAAGFQARPVFLNSQYLPLVEDVPALEQFDSIVLRVVLPGGGTLILDPFSQNGSLGGCPFAAGNRGLEIRPDGCSFEDTSLPAGAESFARNSFLIQLNGDGSAQASAEAALQGTFAAAARLALGEMSPAAIQGFYEKAARAASPGAVLAEGQSDHLGDSGREVSIRLRFGAEELGIRQGDILVLDVPAFPLPLTEVTMYLGLESRQNPLLLGPPAASRTRTEIRLPDGAEVLYLPPDLSRTEPEWTARRSFRHDAAGGTILVEAEIGVTRPILPADAYPRAREFFSRWLDRRSNMVILRIPGGSGPEAPSPGGGKGK